VPELWNENSNVYVYLYPRGSGCGPSFKVPDSAVMDSLVFQELLMAESSPTSARSRARSFGGRDSLSVAPESNDYIYRHRRRRVSSRLPDNPYGQT
jgi:hypothetical protein